jgi:hypothetical protein
VREKQKKRRSGKRERCIRKRLKKKGVFENEKVIYFEIKFESYKVFCYETWGV